MFFLKNAFATVWKVTKVEDKYARVTLGTSEKKLDGTYENSNWFATFVGKAKEKIEDVKPKDRITIVTGKVSNVGKKQEDGTFINYLNVVVFDFVKQGEAVGDLDTPPQQDSTPDDDDDDLPF